MSTEEGRSAVGLVIRELGEDEMMGLLDRNRIGRIAFAHGNRIGIVPVHYVRGDRWIYGRTSPGEKLDVIRHQRWVAFEVDEVEGLLAWRSVVVHGNLYTLDPDEPGEQDAWRRGVELLRTALPETLREGDPAPFRTIVFRIAIQEATGRAASAAE